jgi:hypothetical protein
MTDLEYWKIDAPVGATSVRLEGLGPNESIKVYLYAINSIGAQSTIVDIATYMTSPDLPVSGEVAPPSANLIPNATFENGAQRWSFMGSWGGATGPGRIDPPSYHNAALTIPGPVRNAIAMFNSGYSGVGAAAAWQSESFAVVPGETMVGFADLHAIGVYGAAGIAFYTTTGAYVGELLGNAIAPKFNVYEWAYPAAYTTSRARGVVPAGAQVGRATIWALGTWTTDANKFISIYQPFAGRVPPTATLYPVWTASGSNVAGPPNISEGIVVLSGRSIRSGTHLLADPYWTVNLPYEDSIAGYECRIRIEGSILVDNTANTVSWRFMVFGQVNMSAGLGTFGGSPSWTLFDRILPAGSQETFSISREQVFTVSSLHIAPSAQRNGQYSFYARIINQTPGGLAYAYGKDVTVDVTVFKKLV